MEASVSKMSSDKTKGIFTLNDSDHSTSGRISPSTFQSTMRAPESQSDI